MAYKTLSNGLKLQMFLVLGLFSAVFLGSCGKSTNPEKPSSPAPKVEAYSADEIQKILADGNILVLDSQKKPLVNAQVLIGQEFNDPFANNLLRTNDQGIVAIPSAWKTEEAVTVESTGFVRLTYLAQKPSGLLFQLKELQKPTAYELNGKTSGHILKDKDDVLDFGLAMESMGKQDLMTFDLSKMISPFTETISVAGVKLDIPGNITIPKQKETYIITVTFEKPVYRLSFSSAGEKQIYALRGQFPFKKIAKEMSNKKPFYELINYFSFVSAATQNINLSSEKTTQDLDLSQQLFSQKIAFTAPAFSKDQILVAVTAVEQAGRWYPMDVKRFESAQVGELSTADSSKTTVVSILKNKSEFDPSAPGMDRLSAVIQKQDVISAPALALIRNPEIVSATEARFFAPTSAKAATDSLGTYAALNNLVEVKNSKGEVQIKSERQWEFYASSWLSGLKIPNFPSRLTSLQDKKRRLEVMFMTGPARKQNSNHQLDQELIENATRITRSSVDF